MNEEETLPAAEMAEAEREHYEQIKSVNKEVQEATFAHDMAKAHAKSCKEILDSKSMMLSSLISEGPRVPDPQKELPFSEWEDTPIGEVLKLTEKQRDRLAEASITTVGRFEFVRGGFDPDYPSGLRSIKGFGTATVDAMENDVVEWLSKNAREAEKDGEQ